MFLINSRSESFAAALKRGQTLSRSYGRCFAEFLNEGYLVRLGLLDLLTCVGFGTICVYLTHDGFSRQSAYLN